MDRRRSRLPWGMRGCGGARVRGSVGAIQHAQSQPRKPTGAKKSMIPCPICSGELHGPSWALSRTSGHEQLCLGIEAGENAIGGAGFKELHDPSKHEDMTSPGYPKISSFHLCSQARYEPEFRFLTFGPDAWAPFARNSSHKCTTRARIGGAHDRQPSSYFPSP